MASVNETAIRELRRGINGNVPDEQLAAIALHVREILDAKQRLRDAPNDLDAHAVMLRGAALLRADFRQVGYNSSSSGTRLPEKVLGMSDDFGKYWFGKFPVENCWPC